jgi:hypothetical protein
MSKKLVAKIPLPNKKQNSKHAGRRSKRNGPKSGSGRNLVGGFKPAATSLSRLSEGFMPLFPARTHRTLRYHTNVSIAVTTGAVNTYVFRANDLFDPDFTSTGHQPMGFDQMMVFYNHFAVNKCRIYVQANNTASGCMHAGVRLDASSTALTSADQILEFGGVTCDVLEAKNTYGCVKSFDLSVDIAKIQGIPRQNITTDPNLRGDAGTSPVEATYFHLFAWDPNSLSGTVNFDVILEYDSWFMEPRDGTLSLARTKPIEEKKSPVTVVPLPRAGSSLLWR